MSVPMVYEVPWMSRLDKTAADMVRLAKENGTTVTAEFNGVVLTADATTTAEDILASFNETLARRHRQQERRSKLGVALLEIVEAARVAEDDNVAAERDWAEVFLGRANEAIDTKEAG